MMDFHILKLKIWVKGKGKTIKSIDPCRFEPPSFQTQTRPLTTEPHHHN